MADQVCPDIFGQITPGRREVQDHAVAPPLARVCVRPVQQPVVHDDGVPDGNVQRDLIRVIGKGEMSQPKLLCRSGVGSG